MVKKIVSTQLTLTTIANPVVKLVGCLTTQSPVFDIHLVLPKKFFFFSKKKKDMSKLYLLVARNTKLTKLRFKGNQN